MKFFIKKSDVFTDKNVDEAIILGISDLHYTKSLGVGFLDAITDKVSSLSPTYICFLGDLVDDDSKEVVKWLNDLSKIAPVFFAFGNHDITRYIPAEGKVVKTHIDTTMLYKIEGIKNLTVLTDGNRVIKDGYSFTGYPYYDIDETDNLIYQANNYYNNYYDKETFNSLLIHNPWIMNSDDFNKLDLNIQKNIDLILSGHTHNGMVPHRIDKCFKGNKGLFTPTQGLMPEMSRGHVDASNNSDYLNTSFSGRIIPALRAMPDIKMVGNAVNKMAYPPAIELVRIQKKK